MCKSPKTAKRHVLISDTRICGGTRIFVGRTWHLVLPLPQRMYANVNTSSNMTTSFSMLLLPFQGPLQLMSQIQTSSYLPLLPLLSFLRISRSVDNLLLTYTYLSDTIHTLLRLLIVYVVYGGFAWWVPLQTFVEDTQ